MSRKIDGKFHVDGGEVVKTASGEVLPHDEPLFLLRARDHLATRLLARYRNLCVEDGCNREHLHALDNHIAAFAQFKIDRPEMMKQPGCTMGEPWIPRNPAPADDATARVPCAVCAAVRAEIDIAVQYLDNAPHAEFDRRNVQAFARSLIKLMDDTPNSRIDGQEEAQ